jgi:hypothetical protein
MDIPQEFIVTASYTKNERNGEYYQHFGIVKSLMSLYGDKEEDLRTVKLAVVPGVNLDNRKETTKVDYWGYWNYETQRLSIIYPSFIQFSVCFPYGAKAEEETNRGKCLNLKVVEVLPYK